MCEGGEGGREGGRSGGTRCEAGRGGEEEKEDGVRQGEGAGLDCMRESLKSRRETPRG